MSRAQTLIRPPSPRSGIIARSSFNPRPRPSIATRSPRPPTRSFPTNPTQKRPSSSSSSSKTSRIFGGVAGIGLIIAIYGLAQHMVPTSIWPEPVRTPLKAAIKAKNRGDIERSQLYYRQAIDAALRLTNTSFAPDPLLKVSGIYIALSGLLESSNQPVKAYEALRESLELFGPDPLDANPDIRISGRWAGGSKLAESDHIRAIGLYQKLGRLALQIATSSTVRPYPATSQPDGPKTWDESAEQYLSGALTAMLRLGLSNRPASSPQQVVVGRDIDLPESPLDDESGRVDKRGLGVTMESLAEVYARKGQYDLAGQLLLQAVSILLPPQATETPSVSDRCQAALLMTTISSYVLHANSPQAIKTSRSWSLRSLQIAEQAPKDGGGPSSDDPAMVVCGRARSMASYNLGILAEIESDLPEATKQFQAGLDSAKEVGFKQGQREASDAIRRIRGLERTGPAGISSNA